jgi:dihydroorotate dehydrogenase (NAD+) catalytic subunit
MLNSIGMENPGLDVFLKEKMPFLKSLAVPVIVSIAGDDADEFYEIAEGLNSVGVSAVEINLSCPNLNKRIFAQDKALISKVVSGVRSATKKTVIAKLSPNVSDISEYASAAENAGADALSLINTLPGMAVDVATRKTLLGNIYGGLSGPAVKPVGLKMVWDAYNSVDIPIIGMGGIAGLNDALEYMICGATGVCVGTANFVNPDTANSIIKGMSLYLRKNGISGIEDIIGSLKT